MRWRILVCLCLPVFLIACSKYEIENKHLREEMKMVREENEYLKAEIVGLKRELTEVAAKMESERQELRLKFEDERAQLQKKVQEEREAMQKRIQEVTKKKDVPVKKEQKEIGSRSNQPLTSEGQTPTLKDPSGQTRSKIPPPRPIPGQ